MNITKETKERFVSMLKERQIIVIECDKSAKNKNYNYKFIGANEYGRWDFTPLVAEFSGYPNNRNKCVMRLSVRGIDAAAIIADTLMNLENQDAIGIRIDNYHSLHEKVRNLICTFYI